jgi:hypothetical protein
MAKCFAKRVGDQIVWLEEDQKTAIRRWNAEPREPYDLLVGFKCSIPTKQTTLYPDDIIVEYDPHSEEFIPYRNKCYAMLDQNRYVTYYTLYPPDPFMKRDFTCVARHAAEESLRSHTPIGKWDIIS